MLLIKRKGCEALVSIIVDFPSSTDAAPVENRLGPSVAGTILAAVDLSEDSSAVAVWASQLAEKTGAPLQILHVLHDPAENPGKYARCKSDPLEPMADTAERMLSEFMTQIRATHPGLKSLANATARLAEGLPAPTIVNEAGMLGASLVVIGCRRKNGMAKLLYGSVAERVLALSPVAVTVMKAPLA